MPGKPDYILLTSIIILVVAGILILASVSAPLSQQEFGRPAAFLTHQIVYGLIPGILLGFVAFRMPLQLLQKWSWLLLLVVLAFMLLVFVPKIGISLGGASRWVALGPVSFQPSEFFKIVFLVYLASWLAKREKRGLVPFFIIMAVATTLLIFQPDVSTWVIVAAVSLSMYFMAGSPIKYTLMMFILGLAGLAALIKVSAYRFNRFLILIYPDIDPQGISYQLKQSLIAVGSGGLAGAGLGMGMQKFGLLPQPMSDSIFAVFAEETGFLGAAILVLLFLIIAWRGFTIAGRAQDKFPKLLALGISCWICLQAFVNMGAIVGILPLTGIPLPFISYGGSSLVAELVGVGILLNISRSV